MTAPGKRSTANMARRHPVDPGAPLLAQLNPATGGGR
jgi:hypothetical protein